MNNVQYKIAAAISTNALHESLEHLQRMVHLLEKVGVGALRKADIVSDDEFAEFKNAQSFLAEMQRLFKSYKKTVSK